MRANLMVLLLPMAAFAAADNAALTGGGQPRMLTAHASVRMESEVVKLVVHYNRVDADCTFVFANDGKETHVRMGFPDFGLWAYAYPKKKPQTMFKSYASYVDGRRVNTKLILGKDPGEQWQVKEVRFPSHGKRTVREVYTTELGGVGLQPHPVAFATYLLHTGASWKGPIGSAVITVTLDPDTEVTSPLALTYLKSFGELKSEEALTAPVDKPGGVLSLGVSKPVVQDRTLRFERKNWKPTKDDDIYVGFLFPKRLIEEMRKKAGQTGKSGGQPHS